MAGIKSTRGIEMKDSGIKRDIELLKATGKIRELGSKYKAALRHIEEQDKFLEKVVSFKDAIRGAQIPVLPVVQSKESEATAVVLASDWHAGEKYKRSKVNGLNEFNLETFHIRQGLFFQRTHNALEMLRSKSRIDTVVLGLLGDFITGYIHDDLKESNSIAPCEEITVVYEALVSGINFLLNECHIKRLILPCCVGNHGRTTIKPRSTTKIENNYEWLLYYFIKNHFRKDPRVELMLPEGTHQYLDVYGFKLRFHHGDNIKYQGGIGGIHIPLKKAIDKWNQAIRAYMDFYGHWHSLEFSEFYTGNGSLIGYGPYSLDSKCEFQQPKQALVLIHPQHGAVTRMPILLT